jgi:hypothetical protein
VNSRHDDLSGVDDLIAERALAQRALLRCVASAAGSRCQRHFSHPREPIQFDDRRCLVIDNCGCVRSQHHDAECLCGHGVECRVYDVDGREHHATRLLTAPKAAKKKS